MLEKIKNLVGIRGTQYVAKTERREFDRDIARFFRLRAGMWVTYGPDVGILTELKADRTAVVMLVDEEGLNRFPIACDVQDVRQATHSQIPEKRRPPRDEAQRLGYY